MKKKNVHKRSYNEYCRFFKKIRIKIINLDYSPIKGPNGKYRIFDRIY